jgi:hypothetical protein
VDGGVDEDEISALQYARCGGQHLSPARSYHWRIVNEKAAITAEPRSVFRELWGHQSKIEDAVEQAQRVGCIRRAATQTCAGRDDLVQMHFHWSDLVILLQDAIGLQAKIVALVAGDGGTGACKLKRRRWNDLEDVRERHGVKARIKIMVSVGPLPQHAEPEVDLAWRERNHIKRFRCETPPLL